MGKLKRYQPPVPLTRAEAETLNEKEKKAWQKALKAKVAFSRRYDLAKRGSKR